MEGDPHLIELIESEIIDTEGSLAWDQIAKLDDAKRLLKEAVVLPMLMPEVFTGIREPWKGILLYGPPGTGKTLLAKAVASECQTTFFNVSAATLVSKYHGESEKMVKTLFGMARHYAPTVVFFDEIDALMMSRGSSSESEAGRRLKVEMLQQMDGVNSGGEHGMVMVLATTNKPWDLDDALRRRLEKRIYIPLPDGHARAEAFLIHLQDVQLDSATETIEAGDMVGAKRAVCTQLAARTEGYSGSDIRLICREAAMMPMRRLVLDHRPEAIAEMKAQGTLNSFLGLRMADFEESISRTSSSVDLGTLEVYDTWTEEFASN